MAPPACVRHHPARPLLPAFHPPRTAFRGPIRGLHRRSQWHRPHASATTQHSPCSQRFTHPVQRFVAP
eukprot:4123237-Pyramimonas_sp.AAC.1